MRFTASDGLSGVRGILLLAVATAFSAAAQAPEDLRLALVIGNGAYPGPAALANPANDAAAMSASLRTLGFQVTELRDASAQQMRDAVAQVRAKLQGKRAVGMLYYAGHGLQVDFRNYMVPVDARLAGAADVPGQTIDVGQVIDAFKAAGNRMNIVVLDACRDNPFAQGASGKGLAPLDAPSGTLLAYATAPGNVAEDGDPGTGNGLYTSFLVKELQKPAARIEDVFKRVRLQVRQVSQGRQIPWESTSLEEDFYFNDGVKYTFRPQDLQKVGEAARERQARLQREAEEAQDRQRQQAAQVALARLREAEARRLAEQEEAQAQLRESERLKRLSAEQAREERFRVERADWDRIKASRNPDDFYAFLARYPSGTISELAQGRLEGLQKAAIHSQTVAGRPQHDPQALLYRVGDRYDYVVTDGLTGRVTSRQVREAKRVEGDLVEIATESVPNRATQSGALLSDTSGVYDPPLTYFPAGELQVGRKWSSRSIFTSRLVNYTGWLDVQGQVVGAEQIQLPFGTVSTYRIELTLQHQSGRRERRTLWMEPGWGYPLKFVYESRNAGGSQAPNVVQAEVVARKRGS